MASQHCPWLLCSTRCEKGIKSMSRRAGKQCCARGRGISRRKGGGWHFRGVVVSKTHPCRRAVCEVGGRIRRRDRFFDLCHATVAQHCYAVWRVWEFDDAHTVLIALEPPTGVHLPVVIVPGSGFGVWGLGARGRGVVWCGVVSSELGIAHQLLAIFVKSKVDGPRPRQDS